MVVPFTDSFVRRSGLEQTEDLNFGFADSVASSERLSLLS